MRNIRILLNNGKTNIKFDDPLVLENNEMIVKHATVFWNYNNLTSPTHIMHGTKKINFYNGYWTINMIIEKLKENKITCEILPYSCKIKISPTENLSLLKLAPLLGFSESAKILKGKSQVSDTSVNINLGMKYVKIRCDMIDGTKNSFSGHRDLTAVVLPITTEQILKGSVSHFDNINSVAMLDNGIYSELNFETDHNIGNILLEILIR